MGGVPIIDVVNTIWRTTLILGILLVIARLLGRRTLSQLTFFDFVVGITIGNIAASIVSDKDANIYLLITSMTTASVWVIILNIISMKSLPARKLLEAQPLIVVYKGQILEDNLSKRFYNVNDLLELLREQGVFSPSEIEIALIETDGALSILKKVPYQEMTIRSNGSPPESLTMSNMVGKEIIIDGKIIFENLRDAGMDVKMLMMQLESYGVSRLDDVALGLLTPEGKFYFDIKKDKMDS